MRAHRVQSLAVVIASCVVVCCNATRVSTPNEPASSPTPTSEVTVAQASRDGVEAFAELKKLAGSWEGTARNGRTSRVVYRVSAGDSVVVETWIQSRGREALTLYYLDGDELRATHYCPKANQVNLACAGGRASDGLRFELVGGTNLEVPDQSHQHSFWLRVDGEASFQRSETYAENGLTAIDAGSLEEGEPITYQRVDAHTAGM